MHLSFHGNFIAVASAILVVVLILADFQNIFSRRRKWIIYPTGTECWDFTIIIPIHGSPSYFAERSHMLPYKDHCLIALDIGPTTLKRSGTAMYDFADELRAEGWRVELCNIADPGPPTIVQEMIDRGAVTTSYVVRMDCDTFVPKNDLQYGIDAVRRANADIVSVKTYAANRTKIVERFQDLEYRMSMLSRHFRPWMISGACIIAKTSILQRVLAEHSGSYFGEDSETGRIAHARRLNIRHLDLIVETEVPRTWRSLAKQRKIWWTGAFRHTFINFDRSVFQHPFWTFYYVGLVYVGFYYKWDSWANVPGPKVMAVGLPTMLLIYAFITAASNWQVRHPLMLLFPLYALVQSMIFPIVGFLNYVNWAIRRRKLGRYRFPHFRTAWQA